MPIVEPLTRAEIKREGLGDAMGDMKKLFPTKPIMIYLF